MSEKNVSLINFDSTAATEVVKTAGSLAEKTYDNILTSPSQKLGIALGTVIDVGNTILWPVKWVNERTRIFFENNLNRYKQKIDAQDESEILPAPSELAIPILERFTYINDETLAELFTQLLSNASIHKKAYLAHPGFVQIIDRLSPDEALLLKQFARMPFEQQTFPFISLKAKLKADSTVTIGGGVRYTDIADVLKYFPENFNLYIDNLVSLGLLTFPYKKKLPSKDIYESLETKYKEKAIKHWNEKLGEKVHNYHEPYFVKAYGRVSHLGSVFLNAVT